MGVLNFPRLLQQWTCWAFETVGVLNLPRKRLEQFKSLKGDCNSGRAESLKEEIAESFGFCNSGRAESLKGDCLLL